MTPVLSLAERNALVLAHRPLAVRIAQRYARLGLPLEDLVHEGVCGLLDAVSRFDPARGVTFGTYAQWWVRYRVQRYARATHRIAKRPTDARATRRIDKNFGSTEKRLRSNLGRAPTVDEIAEAIGESPEDVALVKTWNTQRDAAIGQDFERGEVWPADHAPGADERLDEERERVRTTTALYRAIAALPARERLIIERRHLSDDGATLAELGVALSISRERTRQLEARALARLRIALGAGSEAA